MTDRLLLGIEYNPVPREFSPTGNYTLLFEKAESWEPLISIGTSSDRIFSPPHTQSVYATMAKSIPHTPLAPYVSVSYSSWENRVVYPFGLNVSLNTNWDAMVQNDGVNTHWLLTYKMKDANISLMLVKSKYFGISTGFKF